MLDYLKNVLGIESFIFRSAAPQPAPLLLIVHDQDLGLESAELLGKMIEAMKLPQDSYQVLAEIDLINQNQAPLCILNFCSNKSPQILEQFPQTIVFSTDSPAVIIKNPQIKKKVWQDLQLVMKFLKEKIEKGSGNS